MRSVCVWEEAVESRWTSKKFDVMGRIIVMRGKDPSGIEMGGRVRGRMSGWCRIVVIRDLFHSFMYLGKLHSLLDRTEASTLSWGNDQDVKRDRVETWLVNMVSGNARLTRNYRGEA